MPGRDEIARSLTGAWEIFLDRPSAMRWFDVSIEGFWRSFAAVVLLAPSYALAALAERQMAATLNDTTVPLQSDSGFVLQYAVNLGLDWLALPLILALLAGPLGIGPRYASFVVARNWCAPVAAVPFGAIGLLMLLGIVSGELASLLMLAALILVLRYNYLIARRSLDAGLPLAVGIVVLDFIVSLVISLGIAGAFAPQ